MKCGLCKLEVLEPCKSEDGNLIRDASTCPELRGLKRGQHGRPITEQTGCFEDADLIIGTFDREIDPEELGRCAPTFHEAVAA